MYPFLISDDSHLIELKQNLNDYHKLYVYLLIASLLPYVNPSVHYLFTSSFECVGAEALRQYIGNKAIVHIFGTSPGAHYTGSKYSKLLQLAKDIDESVLVREKDFKKGDSGDGGLDIVGWFPTQDECPGKLLVFGQCACGKDWEKKQHESDYKKWSQLITLKTEPVNTIFIPQCFRNANGDWFAKHKIHMSVMVDRLRIMKLYNGVPHPLDEVPSKAREIIENILCENLE